MRPSAFVLIMSATVAKRLKIIDVEKKDFDKTSYIYELAATQKKS